MPISVDAACAALLAAKVACHAAVVDLANSTRDEEAIDCLICAAEQCEDSVSELRRD